MDPFRLERWFAQYEFAVRHLLCSSDCESISVGDLVASADGGLDALLGTSLGYTESRGAPTLRAAIARQYRGLDPDDVLVFGGAQEAIYVFARAGLRPGDRVVVQTPCYQSLAEVARAQGCEVAAWPMRRTERGWTLSLDELAPLLTPRPRAIIVNTPHNPTGWHMPSAMQRELAALCAREGIALFCDEVYRGLEADPSHRLPAACELDGRAVSLGVMSKTYGLAGLRIGWVATRDRPLLDTMATYKDYTSICNSAPSEALATIALEQAGSLAARNRSIIRDNVARMRAFAARRPGLFEGFEPEAGPIAFPRLDAARLGAAGPGAVEALCRRLARDAGVLLLPGSMFDAAWSGHVRVGYGRRRFPEALDAFERAVAAAA